MTKLSVPLATHDTKGFETDFKHNNSAYLFVRKMTIAGAKVTVRKYRHPLKRNRKGIIGRKPFIKGAVKLALTPQQVYKRRHDNIQRSKNRFENSVHANYPLVPQPYRAPVEVTLTYARIMLDRKQILKDTQEFMRSMNREYGQPEQLKWHMVFERQKKRGLKEGNAGSWHAHIVFYNLGYNARSMIHLLWGQGSTSIKRKTYGYESAKSASYNSKYFTKDAETDLNKSSKMYLCSHNLHKPEDIDRPFEFSHHAIKYLDSGYVKTFISKVYEIACISNAVQIEVWEPKPTT
jgi:hypothetical protein